MRGGVCCKKTLDLISADVISMTYIATILLHNTTDWPTCKGHGAHLDLHQLATANAYERTQQLAHTGRPTIDTLYYATA